MMENIKDEWDALFLLTISELKTFQDEIIRILAAQEVLIGSRKLISSSKHIIDDILLWCDSKPLLLIYFECVRKILLKYKVLFFLDKCMFLKTRVGYVGHDILTDGNYPAASNFSMIDDWPLPVSDQSLFSFIVLVICHHRYAHYV